MTREEAIIYFKRHIDLYCVEGISREAEEIAIKALDQEPCEDVISRHYLLDNCVVDKVTMPYVPVNKIENAPPVTPQTKIGKWIKSRDMYGNYHFTCPFCEHDIATEYDVTWKDNYCSNCGTKLQGVVEE